VLIEVVVQQCPMTYLLTELTRFFLGVHTTDVVEMCVAL